VIRGKAHFQVWEHYVRDLMDETAKVYAEGATIDEAVKRVSAVLLPKYSAEMPTTFPQDVVANIQKAYRVVSGDVK
jgi:hypothetical protein